MKTVIVEGYMTIINKDGEEVNILSKAKWEEGFREGEQLSGILREQLAPETSYIDWTRIGKVRITVEVLDDDTP